MCGNLKKFVIVYIQFITYFSQFSFSITILSLLPTKGLASTLTFNISVSCSSLSKFPSSIFVNFFLQFKHSLCAGIRLNDWAMLSVIPVSCPYFESKIFTSLNWFQYYSLRAILLLHFFEKKKLLKKYLQRSSSLVKLQAYVSQLYLNMTSFTCIFQGFLIFRGI